MTRFEITVAGARGGSGTTTVAAVLALALAASRHAETELTTDELDAAAALLGLAGPAAATDPIGLTEQLTLRPAPSGTGSVAVHDAGRLHHLDPAAGRRLLLGVLRGPCYLGLRSLVAGAGPRPDGIVLLAEPGRSLTHRDVTDVSSIPVVARIPVTARVARTIDAGLLIARWHRLPEFGTLRRYASGLLAPPDDPTTPRTDAAPGPYRHPHDTVPRNATDLPVPLSGTSRASRDRRAATSRRAISPSGDTVAGGHRARHRQAQPRSHRVLHR